ncbi:MAG: hypothetical protein HY321_12785 [Armatimonadetes bacterium]|nr:hypothetical protein [Armatimonadota bacterium]
MEHRWVPRVIYGTYATEERLQGLVRFCRAISAEEVMLVPCDTPREPVWLPRERIPERVRHTRRTIEVLKENGIEASINVVRVLMPNRESEWREPIGFRQALVALSGYQEEFAPCPLDEVYRDYMRFFFARLGETGAPKILVDDDFRYEYLTRGPACFCPLHIQEFNKRHARDLTREQLVEACGDAAPNAIKRDWLDFKRTTLLELAVLMEQALHTTNKEARLGIMLTSVEAAAYGGRKTRELVEAFAGGLRPLVRVGQGWYQDYDRMLFPWGVYETLFQKALLPEDTEVYAEIDGYPHGPFVKASRMLLDYQVKANLICNVKQQSVWGFSPEEHVDENHPFAAKICKYGEAHRAIAAAIPDKGRMKGIRVVRSEDVGLVRPQKLPSWPYEIFGHGVPVFLWRLGIPITCDDAPTIVLTKDSVLIDPAQVERYLGEHHALITLDAVRAICEVGLADRIGVSFEGMLSPRECLFEQLADHPASGDYAAREFHSRVRAAGRLVPRGASAVAISHFADADGEAAAPGIVLFEKAGRRVAVLPYELGDLYFLPTLFRKEQLRNVLEWLNGTPLPAFVDRAADVCPVVWEDAATGRRVVSLLNIGHDRVEDCDLTMEKPWQGRASLRYITDRGAAQEAPADSWREENGRVILRLSGETGVNPFDVRVFTLSP